MKQPLRFQIGLLKNLLGFALKLYPETGVAIAVGLISSALEVLSLALLIPLTMLAAHQSLSPASLWHGFAHRLGLEADAPFFIVAFFLCLFARTVTQMVAFAVTNHVVRRLNATFSTRALEAFVDHLSFEKMQKGTIGHFIAIAGDEAVRASQIVGLVVKLVPLTFLFSLYAAMIAHQSPMIFLGIVCFVVITAALLMGAFRKSRELGWRSQIESREAGTHFIDTLNSLRTVRSLNAERYVTGRYRDMMHRYMRTLYYIDTINSLSGQVPTLLLSTGMVAAVGIIAPATLIEILPGIVIGVMMVLRLLPLASQAMDIALKLVSDLKAAQNVSEVIEAARDMATRSQNMQSQLIDSVTHIAFENVTFGYEPLTKILSNLSFTLSAGKSYALVGPSGAGKSTVIDLLLKFYVPRSGKILINGEDCSDISGTAIRSHVVLVEQTPRTFSGTIESNIRFGHEATDDEVFTALGIVDLHDLINSLPEGVNTVLRYQGGNISGGQRQRIGLARALVRHADVLIMDESTSALDPATRERMLDAILPRYRDRILIFISHDPAILGRVDEVIHLNPVSASPEAAEI